MKKTNKELINILYKNNKPKYNLLKAAEEFQELSLALTQRITKPTIPNSKHICEEIAHAQLRLDVIKKIFNSKFINEELSKKEKSLFKKFKDGKHKKTL